MHGMDAGRHPAGDDGELPLALDHVIHRLHRDAAQVPEKP